MTTRNDSTRTAYSVTFTLTVDQDAADLLPGWPGHNGHPGDPDSAELPMTGVELLVRELTAEMVAAGLDHLERRHPDLDATLSLSTFALDKSLTRSLNWASTDPLDGAF